MPLISVIIPVYNAEGFLRECFDSLLAQSLRDFEVICVDDGSTDATLTLLTGYAAQDGRLRVVHQQNQFAGAARNRGMDAAAGDYLLFLDADDMFAPDLLEALYTEAKRTGADITVCNAEMFRHGDGKTVPWQLLQAAGLPPSPFPPASVAERLFLFAGTVPWNKLFRRAFVSENQLRFMALPRANDLYFVYAALALANSIAVVPRKLVRYRVGYGGSLQAGNTKDPCCFLDALQALRAELLRRGCFAPYAACFAEAALRQIFYNFDTLRNKDAFEILYAALQGDGLCALGLEAYAAKSFRTPALRLRFRWITNPRKKRLLRSRAMRRLGIGFCELLGGDIKSLFGKAVQKLRGR